MMDSAVCANCKEDVDLPNNVIELNCGHLACFQCISQSLAGVDPLGIVVRNYQC